MKRILSKVVAAIWLVIVTPLFGILPLFCLLPFTGITKPLCHLEMAILWEVIILFGGDSPTPGIDDQWPPVTPLQLGLMCITVLAISAGALFILFRFIFWTKQNVR
jgi:hypothetical protein